ncbi:MAG: DUF2809 domain-containing protein [Calditrichaceae bacterium]|nr:DUF2809 domain-containing protein [Calditrichaceae bacterium]
MRIKFNKKFLIPFIIIFLIEVSIAIFINDSFIRPIFGDVLVVILIYFFVRMMTSIEHIPAILGVFIFACIVEFAQYFKLINYLQLQDNSLARTVLGTTFNVTDFFAYFAGAMILFLTPFIIQLFKKKN